MKKLLTITLALSAFIVALACGSNDPEPTEQREPSSLLEWPSRERTRRIQASNANYECQTEMKHDNLNLEDYSQTSLRLGGFTGGISLYQ